MRACSARLLHHESYGRRLFVAVDSTTSLQLNDMGHAAIHHTFQQRQAGTKQLPGVAHGAFVLRALVNTFDLAHPGKVQALF